MWSDDWEEVYTMTQPVEPDPNETPEEREAREKLERDQEEARKDG